MHSLRTEGFFFFYENREDEHAPTCGALYPQVTFTIIQMVYTNKFQTL